MRAPEVPRCVPCGGIINYGGAIRVQPGMVLHATHWRVFGACTEYAIGVGNRSSEAGVTES